MVATIINSHSISPSISRIRARMLNFLPPEWPKFWVARYNLLLTVPRLKLFQEVVDFVFKRFLHPKTCVAGHIWLVSVVPNRKMNLCTVLSYFIKPINFKDRLTLSLTVMFQLFSTKRMGTHSSPIFTRADSLETPLYSLNPISHL